MKTSEIIGYIQQITFENEALKVENERLQNGALNACQFYNSVLTVEMVSMLHRLHPDTIREYVKRGVIEKHPDSSDRKILIRASDALLFNHKEAMKKGAFRKHNLTQKAG